MLSSLERQPGRLPYGLRTIPEILAVQAQETPDAPALLSPDGDSWSYRELKKDVDHLVEVLRNLKTADDTRGPRIGIALPNGPRISIALLAASSVGAAAPFNPLLTARELEPLFKTAGIDALLVEAGAETDAILAAQANGVPVLRLSPQLRISGLHARSAAVRECQPDDVALLLFTSGSTGRPKLVPLSHRNVCRSALDVARSVALVPRDRCLVMWEQFHIGGLVDLLLAPIVSGSSLVAAGTFDPVRFFALCNQFNPTWFQAVPATLGEAVLQGQRHIAPSDIPQFRFIRCVAAALSPAMQEEASQFFNVPIIRTLGMTEAGPLITSTALPPAPDKPGSVGRPAGPEVCILGEQGFALKPGTTGQVAVRGENVFSGYADNEQANQHDFVNDWFLTGDLGYIDSDGDLFLTGRKKEQINRGGEKISPQEVDDALMSHPAVREAASYAVPHGRLGEDIASSVVVSGAVDVEQIRRHLVGLLAGYKIPGKIHILDALPRNAVGKIDRLALSALASAEVVSEFVPPSTENERVVVEVWQAELGLQKLSITQDFTSSDGDSLSAIRVLVALEDRYDVPLPSDLADSFTTVQDMARRLDAGGYIPSSETRGSDFSKRRNMSSEALAERGVYTLDRQVAREAVSGAATAAELKLILDYLIIHLCPADIGRLMSHLKRLLPGATNPEVRVWRSFGLFLALRKWRQQIRREINSGNVSHRWSRETIVEDVLLFSDTDVSSDQKTLVVGFSGNRMRLLMPTYNVLGGFDPDRVDLLVLIDRSRRLFEFGIPALGGDIEAIAAFLRDFADARGYHRVVGLGTSGGSLAVLAAARKAEFSVAVSVASASLEDHKEWYPTLQQMVSESGPELPPIRVVHGNRSGDRDKAGYIKEVLPEAELIEYKLGKKNIFGDACKRGTLPALFDAWFARG